jgi:prepilin-type N-terminal cleavage/methylation domain-containing protein
MTKKQKGFTLVELMIVVAIIGILAAVAIPKFAQMLEKSREGATKGNLGAIRSAVSNYYADQQGWNPVTLDSVSYMTNTGNSLPAFTPTYLDTTIPGVKVTGKNTSNAAAGQGPGAAVATANSITAGSYSSPVFLNTSAGVGWKYDASTTVISNSGVVWVNSEMVDMSNISYTTYGFQ